MQKRKMFFLLLALTIAGIACSSKPEQEPAAKSAKSKEEATPQPKTEKESTPMARTTLPEGVYAKFETSLGDFTARLYADRTPKTVQNFVELAEGTKPHKDPATGDAANTPLYNNRKIFRVIKGFMFQTGAASDTNDYSPGFRIPDEILPDLKFTKPGLLAMANVGQPNSGACQFFVTFGPTPQVNGGYTIFGEVVQGMENVQKIELVPVQPSRQGEKSLPLEMPVIKKTTILRIGKDGQPLAPEQKEPATKK